MIDPVWCGFVIHDKVSFSYKRLKHYGFITELIVTAVGKEACAKIACVGNPPVTALIPLTKLKKVKYSKDIRAFVAKMIEASP